MSALVKSPETEPVSPTGAGASPRNSRVPGGPNRHHLLTSALDYLAMVVVLAAIVGLFGFLSRNFLTAATFQTLANQIPALLVISVGMTFVILTGGIDLSVGSVMALSSAVLGLALVDWKLSLPVAILLAIAAGGACGVVSGIISVRWALPSFIVTLGMLEAARGGAYLVTESQAKYIGAPVEGISQPLGGLGLSAAFFAAVLVAVLGQVLLSKTVFGRYMVAIGTNEEAVRLSGINPRPAKVAVFVISGILAALAGVFNCSQLSSADPNAGIGWELSAIAAVVIGGTSLAGGRGSVGKTIFGVLIIAVLEAGLFQTGVSEPVKRLVTGLVIVLAVILDALRRR